MGHVQQAKLPNDPTKTGVFAFPNQTFLLPHLVKQWILLPFKVGKINVQYICKGENT